MDKKSLEEGLQTITYGKSLYYYDITDSTNTRITQLLEETVLNEGTVAVAGIQTKGRGTSGNKWVSATPEGLWMSVLVYEPVKHHPLSFVPAIAIAKVLNEVYNVEAHLKWPNDILVGSKKMGGILCESFHINELKGWIIGFGLNINQTNFPDEISNKAISLHQVTGNFYSIESIFKSFIKQFEEIYLSNKNIIKLWKDYSRILNKQISAEKNKISRNVQVLDISSSGALIIKNEKGELEEWFSASDLDINTIY